MKILNDIFTTKHDIHRQMLSPKQLRCIDLLSSEVPQKEIAQALGVSDRTIQRWLKLEEFQEALQGISYRPVQVSAVEVVDSHQARRSRLDGLMNRAIDVLEETLVNPDARTTDKLKAAQMVGEWSGAGKVENLDLLECYQKLMTFGLIPQESVDKIIEAYDAMKVIMLKSLDQKSLP